MTIIDGHNVLFTNEPIGEHPDSTKDIPFLKNRHWVREYTMVMYGRIIQISQKNK
jgi:hypothetical protein